MKQSAPSWRFDNIYPLVGLIIALILNLGALFWWGGRIQLSQEIVIANQKQQYEMWLKLETRMGQSEVKIAQAESFHEEIKRILQLR